MGQRGNAISAFEVLAEWAWASVQLKEAQAQYKKTPTELCANKVREMIPPYRQALRLKKRLSN